MAGRSDFNVELGVTGEDKVAAALDRLSSKVGQASSGFSGLTSVMGGLNRVLGVFGVALGAQQFVGWIKSSIEWADRMDELATSIGTTVEELGALQFAAQTSGVDVERMVGAIGKFVDTLEDARRGSAAAAGKFEDIGVNFKDLKDLNPAEAFLVVARAISAIDDPAKKITATTAFWGDRLAVKLIPALETLSRRSLPDLVGAMNKAGMGVDKEMSSMASDVSDALDAIGTRAKVLGLKIAGQILGPIIEAQKMLKQESRKGEPIWSTRSNIQGLPEWLVGRRYTLVGEAPPATIPRPALHGPPTPVPHVQTPEELAAAERARQEVRRKQKEALDEELRRARTHYEQMNEEVRSYQLQGMLDEENGYLSRLRAFDTFTIEGLRALKRYGASKQEIEEFSAAQRLARTKLTNERLERDERDVQARLTATRQEAERIREEQERARAASWSGQAEAAQQSLGWNAQELAATGLEDVFSLWAQEGRTVTEVFRSMATGVAQLLGRIVALKLMGALFGWGGGGAGFVDSPVGGSGGPALGADGGLVIGPGTGTSDSIPARLSAGEYVVPARAVASPGMLDLLERIRTSPNLFRNFVPSIKPVARGFASGGLVPSPAAASPGGTSVLEVRLAEGLVGKFLQTSEGQRMLLKANAAKARALGKLLGR